MAWKDLFYPPFFHHANHVWVLQRLPAFYEELGDTERALQYHRGLVEHAQERRSSPPLEGSRPTRK